MDHYRGNFGSPDAPKERPNAPSSNQTSGSTSPNINTGSNTTNNNSSSEGCPYHPGASLLLVGDYKVTGWAAHYIYYVADDTLEFGWFPNAYDLTNGSYEEDIDPNNYPANEWENYYHPFNNIGYGGYSFCRTNDGRLYYSADQ